MSRDGVFFKRSGTSNERAFEQTWYGQVINNSESIQGAIEQTTPAPWKGAFFATWTQ